LFCIAKAALLLFNPYFPALFFSIFPFPLVLNLLPHLLDFRTINRNAFVAIILIYGIVCGLFFKHYRCSVKINIVSLQMQYLKSDIIKRYNPCG
jgi:hypothetical protein